MLLYFKNLFELIFLISLFSPFSFSSVTRHCHDNNSKVVVLCNQGESEKKRGLSPFGSCPFFLVSWYMSPLIVSLLQSVSSLLFSFLESCLFSVSVFRRKTLPLATLNYCFFLLLSFCSCKTRN